MGRPGSGKRIQCDLISRELGYKKVISADILQKEIDSNSDLGIELEYIVNHGNLVSDRTMINLTQKYLKKTGIEEKSNGYVFDGYPRTLKQAKELDKIFKLHGSTIDVVFFLEADEITLIERTLKNGDFSGRADETSESVILKRIENHDKEVLPITEYYKDILYVIDATQSIEGVLDDIMKVIHNETEKKYAV